MTEILIFAGTCGEGSGSYESGVFTLPDGNVRGVEDLADLILPHGPEAASRRGGIARGLRDALSATGPLPRPLGLAASVLGIGLDVLGADGRPSPAMELVFTDGATASIRTEADVVAQIVRDREVVRLAVVRLESLPRVERSSPVADAPETPASGGARPDDRALASIFAYEKRGGRLRRLADKVRDTPDR
jgi:hypothetical protein